MFPLNYLGPSLHPSPLYVSIDHGLWVTHHLDLFLSLCLTQDDSVLAARLLAVIYLFIYGCALLLLMGFL